MPDASNSTSLLQISAFTGLIFVVIACATIYLAWKYYRAKKVRISKHVSLLSALDTGDLVNSIEFTTPGGLAATTYLSLGAAHDYVVTLAQLPWRTVCHVVGIPASYSLESIDSQLDQIHLEGNYDKDFRLFAEPGNEINVRYILDPAAMAITLDFFTNYYWEIHQGTLYVSSHTDSPDPGSLDALIAAIRPALEQPNTQLDKPSYQPRHFTQGNTAVCPICDKRLVADEYWIGCPDGHGCIVTDYQLMSLRELHSAVYSKIRQYTAGLRADRPDTLHCPRCPQHSTMSKTMFSGSSVMLDTCPTCHSYWCDLDELQQVLTQLR